MEVADICNGSAVSQLSEVGAKDGAATHSAPLRAPLELVPWNPMTLVDPDGMTFDSLSNAYVQQFEAKTKQLIDYYNNKTDKTPSEIQKIDEYNNALSEIEKMRKDTKNLYRIRPIFNVQKLTLVVILNKKT